LIGEIGEIVEGVGLVNFFITIFDHMISEKIKNITLAVYSSPTAMYDENMPL
jgi:hypothetical protein